MKSKGSEFCRIRPFLLSGLVPAFLLFAVPVMGQAFAKQVLADMDKFNSGLTSLQAKVTRVDTNDQLKTLESRTGTMIYAPNWKGKTRNPAIRVEFNDPNESLGITNGVYVIFRHTTNQAWTGRTNGTGQPGTGNALAFLSMDRKDVHANFDYKWLGPATLKNGESTRHLRLIPKVPANYAYAEIWVNARGMPVQSMIVQVNKDSTTIMLSNYTENAKIKGSDFDIKIPKSASIREVK